MPNQGERLRPSDLQISRRKWLQASGAGAAAGLTALGGWLGEADQDDSQMTDAVLTATASVVPTEMQFNRYNPTNQGLWQIPVLVDQLAWLDPTRMKFRPGIATDWSIGSDAVTLNLRENQTWHNGDPLVAEDIVVQMRMGKFFDHGMWDYATEVSATDEHTVEVKLSSTVNPTVLKSTLLPYAMATPSRLFKSRLQKLQDASGEEERNQVKKEITEWKLTEPIGNGPFKIENLNSQASELSLHEGHPAADRLNFNSIRNKYFSSNQAMWQALMANELDVAGVATPKNVYQNFPDNIRHTVIPIYTGMAIYFNHQDDLYGDERVRQAVAHVINRKPAAKNAHSKYKPVDIPTGIPKNKPWLSDVAGQFNRYQTDTERAAKLLQEAGYERQNGKWVDSNGNQLEFPLAAPSAFSDWVKGAKTITSHMNSFGFKAQLRTQGISTFFGQTRSEGNFRVLTNYWGGGRPYPYAGLKKIYDYDFPAYPSTWSVPMPVGNQNGKKTTVDPAGKLEAIATSKEKQAVKPIRQLAWTNNQKLPILPVWEQIGQGFIDTANWNLPKKGSPLINMEIPYIIRAGKMTAKPNK